MNFLKKSGLLMTLLLIAVLTISGVVMARQTEEDKSQQGSQDEALTIALEHIQQNKTTLGLTDADLDDLVVQWQSTSAHNGVTRIILGQRHAGIEVWNGNLRINITRDGSILNLHNQFVADLAGKVNGTTPALSATEAVEAAAAHLGLTITEPLVVQESLGGAEQAAVLSSGGISRQAIPVKLMYQPGDKGEVRLVWDMEIEEQDTVNWWTMRVDAETGKVLSQENRFADDSYRVYPPPIESPYYSTPPEPADGRILVVDPATANGSPFGWHDTDGAAGAEFTTTQGNNVHGYTDINNDNSPDAGSSPDGGATLVFDFPIDLTQEPSAYRPAAVTNLFYWNNIIHDVFYEYGFTEANANFQENNYGGGGLGSDYVFAEAQDGGGSCNANMGTPGDGGNPRMQMYICENGGGPPARDGDLDNLVIVHEYGHGISNRLNDPASASCLFNAEQMGEGWSDYWGTWMTIEPGDTGADPRGVGTYLFEQGAGGPGIRPAPYSTDFGINAYTYGDLPSMAVPHGVGFVWATMVWDVTWALIDEYGYNPDLYGDWSTGGNNLANQLVVDGLLLQPCNPGFVDGRDAILDADEALTGGANACTIWGAFAARGLGFSASQGSSSSTSDGVEAFDLPLVCVGPAGTLEGTVTDADSSLGIEGATVTAVGPDTFSTETDANGDYNLALPIGTYDVTASADNYVPVTVTNIDIITDTTTTQDFVLQGSSLTYSPPYIEEFMEFGDVVSNTVTVTNTGPLTIEYEVSIGDFGGPTVMVNVAGSPHGQGEWLYRAETGVPSMTNQGEEVLAYPAAYRWQPAQRSLGGNVLVYADDAIHLAPNTFLDQALQNLGLGYTAHYDNDWAGFETDLNSGTWDLVLVGNDNYGPPTSVFTSLNNYVNNGGKLIYHGWTVGVNSSDPLWATLGFTWVGDDFDPPSPVYWWDAGHPIFNDPEEVPEFTSLTGSIYGIYGQNVEPLAGFEALAGYTTPGPDPNQAALVLGNDGSTVFKGFLDGQNSADLDSDSLMDGTELWINLINGVLNGFGGANDWAYAVPDSGTVPPNSTVTFTVVFDARSMYQVGTFTAELEFSGTFVNVVPTMPLTMHLSCSTCGFLEGDITDALTGDPVEASIHVTSTNGFDVTVSGSSYSLAVQPATYNITVEASGYLSDTASVVVTQGVTTETDFVLIPTISILEYSPASIEEFMEIGDIVTNTVTVTNTGFVDLEFTVDIGGYEGPLQIVRVGSSATVPAFVPPTTGNTAATNLQQFAHSNVVNAAPSVVSNVQGQDVLLDQQPNQVNGLFSDSDCGLCGTGAQSIAENFSLASSETIGQIIFWTGYFPGDVPIDPDLITVIFHEDSGGFPGTAVSTESNVPYERVQTGVILFGVHEWMHTLTLDTPVTLGPGNYWVEIYNETIGSSENFFWETGDPDTIGNGLVGSGWSTSVPGSAWNFDGATELAVQLVTGSGGGGGQQWASAVPDGGTVAAGETMTFSVVFDARSMYQVGTFTAELSFDGNFVNVVPTMPLTMHLSCSTCGFLVGDITDALTGDPVEASIHVTSTNGFDVTVSGSSYSLAVQPATYNFTVEASGYLSETASVVATQGVTTETDFALIPAISILEYSPASIEEFMEIGDIVTNTVTVTNTGYVDLEFTVDIGGFDGPLMVIPRTLERVNVECPADSFGYSCLDSDEPGGPAYNFEDISGTGTSVTLADDEVSGVIPIGFDFDFYGTEYSELYISSNGFLTVLSGQLNGCCSGQPIPTAGNPDGLIAGAWNDLLPPGGGSIHYETLGSGSSSYFVVQFTDIPHYGGGGSPVTFQYKLFEGSNNIEVHYMDAPSDGSDQSAGIENQNGTVGVEYYFGTGNTGQDIAVCYLYPGQSACGFGIDPWAYAIPDSGTVPPGSSMTFDVVFDARSFYQVGTFTAELSFDGNFSNEPPTMPLTMHLSCPTCGILEGDITDEWTGDPLEADIHVTSSGGFDVTLTGSSYSLAIPAGDYDFTVSADGYFSETVTVTAVTGQTIVTDFALTPIVALAETTPDSFEVTVPLDQTHVESLEIANVGTIAFDFELSDRETGSPLTLFIPASNSGVPAFVPPTAATAPAYSLHQFAENKVGSTGSALISNVLGEDILLDQQPNQTNGIFSDVSCDLCGGAQVLAENFSLSSADTVGQIVFWTGYFPGDVPIDPDAITVIFHEDSAGLPGAALYTESDVEYERVQTGVILFGVHEWLHTLTLAAPVDLAPGNYWVEIYNDTGFGTDDFFWEVGNPDTVGNGLPGSAFAFSAPGSNWGYDSLTDLSIQLLRGGSDALWLSEDPISGTVDAGTAVTVDLIFDTTVLTQTGTYTAELRINGSFENDIEPLVVVMHVVEQVHGMEMSGDMDASGAPGDMVMYAMHITNTGNVEDTFNLTLGVHDWTTTLPGGNSVTLAAGASATVMVHVDIPADAEDGETDTVTVTATSDADGTVTASADLTTTAVVVIEENIIYLPIIFKP